MRPLSRHIIPLLLRLMAAIALIPAGAVYTHAKPGDRPPNRPYADLRAWHLGFSVGMHVQDLSFTHNGFVTDDGQRWAMEVPSFSPGFCINVLGSLRLHSHFDLRFTPGMYFGSKGVEMRERDSGMARRQDIKTAYVAVPLDIKITGDRAGNVRPYVSAGAMATFDISKKRAEPLLFNTADAYLCVGLGADFYLPFFKLNPEVKFCFGLTDILRHRRDDLEDDPETFKITQSLKKVKSNMVVLTFYFE